MRRHAILISVCAGFIVVVLGLWLALPSLVQRKLNEALSKVKDYRGTVGGVSLGHIFVGTVAVNDIKIRKKNGKVYLPFFSAKQIEATLQWSQLFHGHLVGDVDMESPRVNFVKGATKAASQVEIKKEWQDAISHMTPFRINHFVVHQGEVHFVTTDTKPKLDLTLRKISVEAKNLTNAHDKSVKYFSSIDIHGLAPDSGYFKLHAVANPLTKPLPSFRLKAELRHLDLTALNDFFRAYGKFDVDRGRFDLFFEMNSTPTSYHGFAKPMLSDINVLDWQRDSKRKNFIQLVWKAIVGTVVSVFKNQPKDRLATVAPFQGTWKKTDVNLFETLLNLLKNAFVRALVPGFSKS